MPQFLIQEGCPLPLERALRNAVFEYSARRKKFLERFKGLYDEEFSITDLYQGPRQIWMKRKWWDDIQINLIRDNYYSLLGNVVHSILEQYAPASYIVEERQHTILNVDGVRVLFHGQPDAYDPETLTLYDYKFVSAYAIMYDKKEYEFQLNAGAYLFANRGIRVAQLINIYMFRHLDPIAMLRTPGYPQENIQPKQIPLWDRATTEKKIKELISKILVHKETHWKKLPECTDDERWLRDTKYAVIKRNKAKSHQRLGDWPKNNASIARFETMLEAKGFIQNTTEKEEMKIEKRLGEPKKCDQYCPVVTFCSQRQNELKSKEKRVLVDS